MDVIQDLLHRLIKGPRDIVGLDLGGDRVKAVRVRRHQENFHVLAADFISAEGQDSSGGKTVAKLTLPKKLRAPYAALAISGQLATVKLLNMPGRFSEHDEQRLIANLGISSGDNSHRIGYSIVSEGHVRGETRVLAVALPEADARAAVAMLPSSGRPAPYALELSGLAALFAFALGPGAALTGKTVGVMDGDGKKTTFAIFHKGLLALVRRFDFGYHTVIERVGEKLGVDMQTVLGFMADDSFDIETILQQSLAPFFKPIIISKEFVEHRENCQLSEILLSGALSTIRGMDNTIHNLLGAETRNWNPFEGGIVMPHALPETITGRESCFAAAFGAAMGAMMEVP